jgi:hypothetical protein
MELFGPGEDSSDHSNETEGSKKRIIFWVTKRRFEFLGFLSGVAELLVNY